MRISILSHTSNRFSEIYACSFRDRGHQIQFLALEDDPLEIDQVEVRGIGPKGFRPTHSAARTPYLKAVLPARAALRRFRPDVLFTPYLSSAGVVGRLTGHPRLVPSAVGTDLYARVDSRIWRGVYRWIFAGSAHVHTVSDHMCSLLVDRFGLPIDQVSVCPLGIQTDRFPQAPFNRRPMDGRILVTRGHAETYDQETVVAGLSRLHALGVSARLTFAHAGSGVENTRKAVERLGLGEWVRFLPGYAEEELPGLLSDCDVYVSASRHDGTSTSLLEALCSGTPVVVSDIEANRPWVRHEHEGLLFTPGNADSLAQNLSRALANSKLRERMGTAGRRVVLEKGEHDVHVDRLLEVFASLR